MKPPDNENRITRWITAVRDPDAQIVVRLFLWEEKKNPVYVWEVIAICAEHGRPLPREVMDYLGEVARRMLSQEARAASDMRKVLPSILGFPDKKRGPGRLLDPDDVDPDKFSLAILFFTEIEQGREPDEALANATRKLPPRFASAELKTLKRWVAQAMKLDDEPTTAADWRSALRSGFSDLLTLLNIVEESRETLP